MRRGVIDIGTNSVKLLIADLCDSDISPQLETSRQTRLGQGLYDAGKLQPEPIRATVGAVTELLALAKRHDCTDTRIIATSAVREASNSGELLDALGQPVSVLSGDDEARLAFNGVMSCPRLAKSAALVIDVGGGSSFASRHEALIKYGSSAGHSFPRGSSSTCALLNPPTPTCARPVTGIGTPAFSRSGL